MIDPLRGVALPKATPGTAQLTTGLCDGEFLGAVSREVSDTRQYAGVEYTWQITSGPDAGKTCSREVGVSLRVGSHRLKLSCDLAGREFAPGEEIDLSGCIGRKYRLRLAKRIKKDGTVSEWVHVESCMLIG